MAGGAFDAAPSGCFCGKLKPKPTNLPTSVQFPWSASLDLENKQPVCHLYLSLLGDVHVCTRSLLGFSETHASAHPNLGRVSIMLRSVLFISYA